MFDYKIFAISFYLYFNNYFGFLPCSFNPFEFLEMLKDILNNSKDNF